MTSIWFPNNKYPPNTKNYLPCFVLGGGRFSIRRKGLYTLMLCYFTSTRETGDHRIHLNWDTSETFAMFVSERGTRRPAFHRIHAGPWGP